MSRFPVLTQNFSSALHERNERIEMVHRARACMSVRHAHDATIALYISAGVLAGIVATFLA